jgi:hypothetical protein
VKKLENQIMMIVFGDKVGENYIMYSSPSIIRMIKSRRMIWAVHIVRMGTRGMHVGFWWEIQKERTTGKTKT